MKIEQVAGKQDTVRILVEYSENIRSQQEKLERTFEKCFTTGIFNIILDLQNIPFPNSSFIALLISATVRARQHNGDISIVNLTQSAKNNLVAFTPYNYLALDKNDHSSTFDHVINDDPAEAIVSANDKQRDTDQAQSPKSVEQDIEDHDIAEMPLLETFEENTVELEHKKVTHLRVKSASANLYKICDFVTSSVEKAGLNERDVGKTKIAVYEACLNIIEHAYHSNPDKWIDVWVETDHEKCVIHIKDYGFGFELKEKRRYNVQAAMEDRKTGGFGLYIIRRSMDDVKYEPDPINGNCLTLTKYL